MNNKKRIYIANNTAPTLANLIETLQVYQKNGARLKHVKMASQTELIDVTVDGWFGGEPNPFKEYLPGPRTDTITLGLWVPAKAK